ncbi:hypothetical protein GCM10007304_10140 [Rhodococcoides trifolii]|uniref:Signal peptidase I n=1 Tax=Rhodococcoides trifolii TaxID=908250 RepID=A0A917CTA1_9NOCA|nr:signal peptidase I [Rhodococcus trifolii]GGF98136.1 hypothetical protein GCM10007304_10140 [Rhodococcus trifolii]
MTYVQEEPTTTEPDESTGPMWWLARIVSMMLLFFFVAILLAAVVIPKVGGAMPYTILTSSMEPLYPPGTLVVVRETDADALVAGTVVTYQIRSGEPDVITHRIISAGIDKDGKRTYTTQGDNNPQPDENGVLPAQIRGTLWYHIPYLGYVNNWLTGEKRTWVVGIAAGGLFLFAATQFVSAGVDRRRRGGRHAAP